MEHAAFYATRKFYDTALYPHGFHRSGEFTRAESSLLENCGTVISQLKAQRMKPAHPEHHAILAVIDGERRPQTDVERVWHKYEQKCREHKSFLHNALRPAYKICGAKDERFI
ncbi:MAG: DUF413 domain-containing protein [Oleiphilaceae bacterium]|nr:DUF413 domain-containing protein [Oleiphilaceae bacterium]